MPNFNLDEYELVEDRLKAYWKDNPNGKITTDVVHITEDGSCVTIKAYVYSCLLYTSPSPRDLSTSRMPSSA